MSVDSPKDGAVFWSGRDADHVSMKDYAASSTDNGITSTTLEQTEGGSYFDKLDLYDSNEGLVSDSQRNKIWGAAVRALRSESVPGRDRLRA